MNNIQPIHQPEHILDDLAVIYQQRKSELNNAKKAFAEIEQRIIDHCGHKEEGAVSFDTDHFKVTTTGKLTRTIDNNKLTELKKSIPEPLFNRLFTFKPSLSVRELHYVEQNEPEWYKEISKAITTKPAKTALTVKEQ